MVFDSAYSPRRRMNFSVIIYKNNRHKTEMRHAPIRRPGFRKSATKRLRGRLNQRRMSDDVLFLASRIVSDNVLLLPPSIGGDRRVSWATRLIARRSSPFNDRLGT